MRRKKHFQNCLHFRNLFQQIQYFLPFQCYLSFVYLVATPSIIEIISKKKSSPSGCLRPHGFGSWRASTHFFYLWLTLSVPKSFCYFIDPVSHTFCWTSWSSYLLYSVIGLVILLVVFCVVNHHRFSSKTKYSCC